MANFSSLKATINANITTNGNEEITGAILNGVLTDMVDALASGYIFKGIATPATNPGTPDENIFYVTNGSGLYSNFDSIVINDGEIAILTYNGSWGKHSVDLDLYLKNSDNADLDIEDESENVLVRFADGHIRTEDFDSRNILPAPSGPDFAVSDDNGNAIVIFKDGHIRTQNFDSSELLQMLAMGENRPSLASIININFNDAMAPEDQSLFNGWENGTLSSSGITLNAGLYPLTFKKIVAFDDEKFQLRISAANTDKILFYSTYSNTGALDTTQNCSYILFDFTAGRISIYKSASVNTSTGEGTELVGTDFTVNGSDYILEIGRRNRQIYAAIHNITDATTVQVEAIEEVYPNVNVGQRPAGWLYYYPSFITLSGTPEYKNLSIGTRDDLYMLFLGDSFTQGYNVLYKDCWTYMAVKHFGNSMGAAISGSRLAATVQQYHDSIKGKVKAKFLVLSIGINDILNGVTTDSAINSWANTYKALVDEMVADGFVPIVNRIWPEGSSNATYASAGLKMNNKIRSWGFDGADFGAVTGYNNNVTYYSNTHLNKAGNIATFQRFANELSKYKII